MTLTKLLGNTLLVACIALSSCQPSSDADQQPTPTPSLRMASVATGSKSPLVITLPTSEVLQDAKVIIGTVYSPSVTASAGQLSALLPTDLAPGKYEVSVEHRTGSFQLEKPLVVAGARRIIIGLEYGHYLYSNLNVDTLDKHLSLVSTAFAQSGMVVAYSNYNNMVYYAEDSRVMARALTAGSSTTIQGTGIGYVTAMVVDERRKKLYIAQQEPTQGYMEILTYSIPNQTSQRFYRPTNSEEAKFSITQLMVDTLSGDLTLHITDHGNKDIVRRLDVTGTVERFSYTYPITDRFRSYALTAGGDSLISTYWNFATPGAGVQIARLSATPTWTTLHTSTPGAEYLGPNFCVFDPQSRCLYFTDEGMSQLLRLQIDTRQLELLSKNWEFKTLSLGF